MTLAQQLKSMSLPGTPAYRAAEAMEAAEKALDFYACVDHYPGDRTCAPDVVRDDKGAVARAALAKLRGEA